ncbi:hypothetical protein AB1L42_02700 [Thalassoglobus sp. JC818]|uniref:hypothetical protein n=1 Tax=Thalassoglobus sp. JC818 TaxID=3232136 RepID=UPI00345762EC
MQEHLIELSVGETFQVGEYTVTLLDVEGDELALEIMEDGQDEGVMSAGECQSRELV